MAFSNKAGKCKICKEPATRKRGLASLCSSIECEVKLGLQLLHKGKEAKRKLEVKQDRERKEKLKSRSDYIKEAQIAFNSYVRFRDRNQPCICCGMPLTHEAIGGGYDCGHYRSTGSAPHLRFNEHNAHAQTKKCNRYGAGRAVDYRVGLIKRIGLEAVEALEADQTVRKFTIEDLKEIKAVYKAKLKALQS